MKTKLEFLQGEVDAVKKIMADNIHKALANNESAESLLEKAEQLREQAKVFKKRSHQLSFFETLKAETGSIMMATLLISLSAIAVVCLLGAVGLMSHTASILVSVSAATIAAAVFIGIRLALKVATKTEGNTYEHKN